MVGRREGADRRGDAGARCGRGGGRPSLAGLRTADLHVAAGDAGWSIRAVGVRADRRGGPDRRTHAVDRGEAGRRGARSEEHTSELQSRQYLVCRLLLEKKKLYMSSDV